MSGSSAPMASLHRRRPVAPCIPLVPCPDCGRPAKVFVSGTSEHAGWTFYKCKHHGNPCNFWHWEHEYVAYLVEHGILRGDAAVDAAGWSKDRRAELKIALGKRKLAEEWGRGASACIGGGASSSNTLARATDDNVMKSANELMVLGREVLLLLKIVVAQFFFIAIVAIALFLKK